MEISLEDLYVGLKGSKDTIYNFSRQSPLKELHKRELAV